MGSGSVNACDPSSVGPGSGYRQGVLRARDLAACVFAPLVSFPSAGNKGTRHAMLRLSEHVPFHGEQAWDRQGHGV